MASSYFKLVGSIFLMLLAAFFLGPRPDTSFVLSFAPDKVGKDLDAYLKKAEAAYSDIRQGLEKAIVWAHPEAKDQTEFAIVYVHGFSASRVEIEPVPQKLAGALDANLFFTRLAGHGRTGTAMAEPSMSDWMNDMAEAVTIGRRIGRKVLLVSASTGGTLSTLAASVPEMADKIAGLIMVSPNFAVQGASTGLLNMPWAETILPLVLGSERSFEPANDRHAHGWTHSYPSTAVFPMAALLRVVDNIDKSKISLPALFVYSDLDTVVVPAITDEVVKVWGGPTEVKKVSDSADPNNHVIAGDILSPNTTEDVSQKMIAWVKHL